MELLFDFPCPNIKSSLFLSTYTTLIENKHFPLLLSQSQDGERFSASMYQKIYHPAASAENASTDVAQHTDMRYTNSCSDPEILPFFALHFTL